MTKALVTTEERFRRHQRDLEAYRRRSLYRRSFARFRRDLAVIPHVFLVAGTTFIAPLERSREEILAALRGRAVWPLDTAMRLAGCRGFLRSEDLTGYLAGEALRELVAAGFVGEPSGAGLSVDPPWRRPPALLAHLDAADPPAAIPLPTGDLVVPWDRLVRDLFGTLGWRPDQLTRIEAVYPAALARWVGADSARG